MNYQGETYPRSQQTFSSRSNHYGFTWHCLEYQIKKGVWHRIGMAIARRCRWTEGSIHSLQRKHHISFHPPPRIFPSPEFHRRFIESSSTGNYYCWGKDIITSGKLAFEWNPRTRRRASDSDGQAVLITSGRPKRDRPSTKIVGQAPPSFFEACGSAMKSRVSWLVIDGSRPNVNAVNSEQNSPETRKSHRWPSRFVNREFSLPLKINTRW